MKLPIERLPNTTPPQFAYFQTINLPQGGVQSIRHVGCVSSSMEAALCDLLKITQQLAIENAALKSSKRK